MCSVRYEMLHRKFLLIFSQLIISVHNGFVQDKLLNSKVIKITRIDGICYGKKVPIQIYSQGVTSDGKSVSMANYTVIAKEDIPERLRFAVVINRCRSVENLDSCEEYYKMRNLDYCQAINPDGMMGKNVLNIPFQPKYKCPIKKGRYSAYNFTLSLGPFVMFNPDGWYWKIKGELFPHKGEKLLACMYFEGHTVPKSQS